MVVRMPPAFNTLDMGRVLLEQGECHLEELATAQVHLTPILQPRPVLLPSHHLVVVLPLPSGRLPMQPRHFSIVQEAQRPQRIRQHHLLLTSPLQAILLPAHNILLRPLPSRRLRHGTHRSHRPSAPHHLVIHLLVHHSVLPPLVVGLFFLD